TLSNTDSFRSQSRQTLVSVHYAFPGNGTPLVEPVPKTTRVPKTTLDEKEEGSAAPSRCAPRCGSEALRPKRGLKHRATQKQDTKEPASLRKRALETHGINPATDSGAAA
ncbi:hypothetical protein N9Z14_08325, partial [Opitutales bacterium]|nr:hypothetical protein [Opitutales bacterium]